MQAVQLLLSSHRTEEFPLHLFLHADLELGSWSKSIRIRILNHAMWE